MHGTLVVGSRMLPHPNSISPKRRSGHSTYVAALTPLCHEQIPAPVRERLRVYGMHRASSRFKLMAVQQFTRLDPYSGFTYE